MRPYYDHAGIVIYHGDCRDVLPHLEKVDLVLTDPPYNAKKDYGDGTDDSRAWDDYCAWLGGIVGVCEDSCSGLVLVFLSVNGLLRMAAARPPRHVCVWDKPMSFAPRQGGSAFLPHWEPCLVYGKPWGDGGRVPNYHLSDVWHSNPATRNGHPCPKPESLLRGVISQIPANLILDPFVGSGTTLVAAKQLNRRAIGIEIEEKYCEIAAKRLEQEVFDFGPAPAEEPVQESLLATDGAPA